MRRLKLNFTGADRVVINGPVSGGRYEFFRDRNTSVLTEDADGLLAMTYSMASCCGGSSNSSGPMLLEVE